ncbi:MAG TPA: HAMP domain-containing sensor histidine kinase [Thermomicrobiales bacterium]|nr:HAMP domain-containing sensor histidine kinase [Thermomicrobiales bacterium]
MNRGFTLPLRRWLALALAITFFVPVCVTLAVAVSQWHGSGGGWWGANPQLDERLTAGAAEWDDPAWQAATRAQFAPLGVDFVLYENGREVYRSTADPLAGTGAYQARNARRLVLPGTNPARTADIYTGTRQGGPGAFWLVPLVGFGTLLVTLATLAWLLGRMVLRPLAATSRAARQIAVGNLDVAVPSSGVREVAEVGAAFDAMSAGLREALQAQAALEQERRFFIGAVVHDLRTPLFSLRGHLDGLEQGLADTPAKRARYIAVARDKAAALERLVTDLFDYTRLEYLDQTPNDQPVDLAALLRRQVESLQPLAEAKDVRLVLDSRDEPCVVDGDSHLLTRAVENLLDNAVRYTPGGGNVWAACRAGPDAVTLTIADTGPGIPAQDLPHLFNPLYRGETSRNRRTGGAGLGLAIARRILLAHGGDLTARNRAEGGAIFTGTLPLPKSCGASAPVEGHAVQPAVEPVAELDTSRTSS